ncbi:MAG TPA: 16S rRNA (uracil(1498)-N(3))-methyltransferase [Anaeromyxobacteraceae bacterium]|nr:16S rRNA (uracil(1498)-N(3))-methyltransferase [Anaeromyxobacteraceae bacterium]
MTVRRLFLPPDRIAEDRARLTPEARHYVKDVLRLAPGATLELFDGQGARWDARVEEGFEALTLGSRRAAAAGGTAVWIVPALAKGEKMDLVVQKATELGAARVAAFEAARSVVRLEADRAEERTRRWRRIAEEAARQCGRADVPELATPAPLAARLAEAPPGFGLVVFHGEGAVPLAALEPAPAGWIAIVGPEGGLTDDEVRACEAAGARRGSLGPRVLRAETAAIAAVALLQARFGDMG